MYIEIQFKGEAGEVFSDKTELLLGYINHLGYMVGGGWDSGTGEGTLFLEIHDCDCGAYPVKKEFDPVDVDKIHEYLTKHDYTYKWIEKDEDTDEDLEE